MKKCIHTGCSREAVYQEVGSEEKCWCKECMLYQLHIDKDRFCKRCSGLKDASSVEEEQ